MSFVIKNNENNQYIETQWKWDHLYTQDAILKSNFLNAGNRSCSNFDINWILIWFIIILQLFYMNFVWKISQNGNLVEIWFKFTYLSAKTMCQADDFERSAAVTERSLKLNRILISYYMNFVWNIPINDEFIEIQRKCLRLLVKTPFLKLLRSPALYCSFVNLNRTSIQFHLI